VTSITAKLEAALLENALLRERVKQLEASVEQLSTPVDEQCQEWKKSLAEAAAEERERCANTVSGFKQWAREGGAAMILLNQIEKAIRQPEHAQRNSDDGVVHTETETNE